jgi:MbtH protein
MFEDGTDRRYRVVRNAEDQHSLWPVDRPSPAGWHADGFEGTKSECLDHIRNVWWDMRPRSLRIHTGQAT